MQNKVNLLSSSNTSFLACIGGLLLMLFIASCNAKSYSIRSLSSDIKVMDGLCDLDIVETFEYEFVGSYSRIGRALPSAVTSVYGISIRSLSNNGFGFRAVYDVIDDNPYIVISLTPSTVETETTRISFQLSYSISSSSKKLFYKFYGANYYLLSYYYKDNSIINQLNSTFYFDPSISFTEYPSSPSSDSKLLNNRTIQFRTFNSSYYTPSVTFTTTKNLFDKCSTFIDDKHKSYSSNYLNSGIDANIIVPAVVVPLIGLFMISMIICMFLSVKYPKHPIMVKFCCIFTVCSGFGGGGEGGGNDDNDRGTTGYSSFNDNNDSGGGGGGSSSNDNGGGYYSSGGGSGFAD